MDHKTYEVRGVIYEHRPQVLGQLKQLESLLVDVSIPAGAGATGMIFAIGDKAPRALAILLTEKGMSPEDKDLNALAKEMEWGITLEQTMEIADDFFSINPLSLAFAKIVGMMERFTAQMLDGPTGTPESASSLQTAT